MADQVIPVIQINEGDVGIGTASPRSILNIARAGTDNYIKVEAGSTGANYGGIMLTEAGINFGWTLRMNAANDLLHISYQDNVPNFTDAVTFTRAGAVKFDAYGAGYLKTDSSGNITADNTGGGLPGGPYLPLSAGSTKKLTDTLYIQGTNSTGAESVLLRGVSSNDGDFLGSIRTANLGGYNQEMRFYTSDANGTTDEDLTLTLKPDQSATFAGNVVIGAVDAVTTGLNIGEASPTIQLFDTTNNAKLLIYTQDSNSIIGTYSNHALAFFTNSTQVLNLDTSQNATFANLVTLGPGTTGSPYDSTTFLHVKGTTRSIVQQSSTDDAYYMFGDADADNVAWLGYAHSSGNLNLQAQTSITLNKTTNVIGAFSASSNISTLAKVGIGTASPQSFTRLDVRSNNSNGAVGIAAYAYNGVGGVAIQGQGFAVDNTHAGSATGIYGISNGGRTITGSTNIGGRFTASGAANNYAIITTAGNVGINNSTPTFSLDVIGTARVSGDTEFPTQSTTDDSTKVATTAFVKNILAEQPAGLTFLGNWNADTNSPTLASGGGELADGAATSVAANKLNDTNATFQSDSITVNADRVRVVQANGNIEFSVITVVDSDTQLTLTDNIVTTTGDTYIVEKSPFLSPEGGYYIVSTSGDEDLNGITDWVSGDWVLIATTNVFQKIDNTSILSGSGVENKIAKWAASSGDPSVTLSSSSITDTGSAVTIAPTPTYSGTTSVTGLFTVNVDADSTLLVSNAGTNATMLRSDTNEELYIGANGTGYAFRCSTAGPTLFDGTSPGIAINTGDMNIGSSGPATDLTSFLNIVSTTVGVNPTLNISCDDLDEASIILSEESGNQGFGARLYYQGSGDNFFNIQIGDGGTWTNRFTIERGGNVGIGLLDPVVKLQVADKSLVRHTNSSWGQFAVANPNDAEVAIVWGAGGTGYPGVTSTYTRQWIAGLSPFSTGTDRWSLTNKTLGSTTAFTALDTGGIGMGTYQPVGKLYVGPTWSTTNGGNFLYIKNQFGGGLASYDPRLTNTTDLGITYVGASSETSGPNIPGLTLYNNSGVAGQFSPMILFAGLESGSSQFKATMAAIYARSPLGTGDNDDWIDGELIFATSGAATQGVVQRMVINKEGLVGIGTNNPGQLLHLNDGSAVTTTDANNMLLLTRDNHSYIMFSCPDNKDSGIHFHNTTDDAFVGRIAYSHEGSSDHMLFTVSTDIRMDISATGAIKFNSYGAGTLVTDSFGNITAATSGPGTGEVKISGGPEAKQIAEWTNSDTIKGSDTLQVNANSNGINIFGNDASGSAGPLSMYRNDSVGDDSFQFIFGSSTQNFLYSDSNSDVAEFQIGVKNTANAPQTLITLKRSAGIELPVVSEIGSDTDRFLMLDTGNDNLVKYVTGANLLSFIGGSSSSGVTSIATTSPILGGTITGSGTISLLKPESGAWFRGAPQIGSDGLMEVGRYIDFHNTNTGTTDFDVRLDCRTGNLLRATGSFQATSNIIAGAIGVGINPPREAIEVLGASSNIAITNTAETDAGIIFRDSGGIASQAASIKFNSSDQKLKFFVNDEVAQRMVIDTNGYVGINTTNPNVPLDVEVSDTGAAFNDGAAQFSNITTASSGGSAVINVRNNYGGGNGTLIKFFRTSTASSIGFISFNGAGNLVVYSTNSDYRLKEDLKSFNGLEIIDQIKTYNYKWKEHDSRGYGTLAHELQEIFPDAVTGEKDAEDMQGVDYSTLVPVLIKSVQELKKEIEELKHLLNK